MARPRAGAYNFIDKRRAEKKRSGHARPHRYSVYRIIDTTPYDRIKEMMTEAKKLKHEQHSKYRKVFQDYYQKLSIALPTNELLPSLLSIEVITMDQKEEIQAKETSSLRACALLDGPIWSGVNSGYPDTFIRLLCLMRLHNPTCEKLSEEICVNLNISDDVIKEVTSLVSSNITS